MQQPIYILFIYIHSLNVQTFKNTLKPPKVMNGSNLFTFYQKNKLRIKILFGHSINIWRGRGKCFFQLQKFSTFVNRTLEVGQKCFTSMYNQTLKNGTSKLMRGYCRNEIFRLPNFLVISKNQTSIRSNVKKKWRSNFSSFHIYLNAVHI